MKQLFLFLLILILSFPTMAANVLTAHYLARGAGLHLMDGQMNLVQTPSTYKMLTQTETRGLLSTLLDARTTFLSEGKINKKQMVVKQSSMTSISGKKIKNRTVDLKDKPGFVDYQTAVLTIMDDPVAQTHVFKIYDGKRELLITFDFQGKVTLPSSKYSSFSGEAELYDVTIEITAGKKKGWFFNRMKDKTAPPLHLYFAPIGPNGEKVLVQGDFDTSLFGTISIYLKELKQGTN